METSNRTFWLSRAIGVLLSIGFIVIGLYHFSLPYKLRLNLAFDLLFGNDLLVWLSISLPWWEILFGLLFLRAATRPNPADSLGRLLSFLLGAIFIYAGALKAANPIAFLDDVRSFQLLPDPFAAWLALGLPWLEILAGLAVVTGLLRAGGLLCLNALLVIFLGAILLSWWRGLDLTCGCFGSSGQISDYTQLIVRDLALLTLGVVAWRATRRAPTPA